LSINPGPSERDLSPFVAANFGPIENSIKTKSKKVIERLTAVFAGQFAGARRGAKTGS
jgi:hypothetical protein